MGYCERCGGRYDFEGLCENCGTDEEWSWNAPHNKNKVVCSGCGNEIYEARRYCHICGRKNEAAFKKGDCYCPKCGNAFENGICPNCGRTLDFFIKREISRQDLRYCTECGEKTSRNDCFCICGSENYIHEPSKVPVKANAKSIYKPEAKNDNPKKSVSNNFDDEGYIRINLNTKLWIILGVVSSLFGCLISGIITTVFAVKADKFKNEGRLCPASKNLDKAERWFRITVIIFVIEVVLGIVSSIFLK